MGKKRIIISTTDNYVKFTDKGMENYLNKFPDKVLYDVDVKEDYAIKLKEDEKPSKFPILSSEDYGDELEGEEFNKLFSENKLKNFNANGKVSKTLLLDELLVDLYLEDKTNFQEGTKLVEVEIPEGFECIIKDNHNRGKPMMKVVIIKEVY